VSDSKEIRYSVVQFVPDPVRQEVLNVGVVVAQGRSLAAKVIPQNQAGRLRAVGYERNLGFLRDLEEELNRGRVPEQTELPEGQTAWTTNDLEKAAREWGGTIRFTPVRPGRVAADRDALEYMYAKLVPTKAAVQRGHTRSSVKKRVRTNLLKLVSRRYANQDPKELVHSGQRAKGKLEAHKFDYGIGNGRPFHLVQTVSFDVEDRESLATELDATKWAITDLRNARTKTVPLSVVASGTKQKELREQTGDVLNKLDAHLFGEDDFEEWLGYVEDSLPATIRTRTAVRSNR
jgi:hypothetical protein